MASHSPQLTQFPSLHSRKPVSSVPSTLRHDSGVDLSADIADTTKIVDTRDSIDTIDALDTIDEASTAANGRPTPYYHDQSASPLLSLPAELRNQIYTHLLVPCPTHLSALRRWTAQNHLSDYVLPALDIHPAILRTCRQAHTEGTDLLYGANTFSAHPALLTQLPFLVKASRPIVCPAVVGRIRRWHVKVRLDTDPRYSAEDVRRAFSDAEEVEVDVWQTQFGACDYRNLGLFEGVRGVGKAVVGGSVEAGFAGWLEGVMMGPVEGEGGGDGEASGEKRVSWGRGRGVYDLWVHGGR
ncbi:hypothetical protein W97_08747 [Coniosporium apollinis CBS 100218]|uniref:F-box domain-containing protein n=1 Tax=Coniosporium apollinis (strain CBS 100218) TaxID=1168221 RepID=R7Z5P7_CONA1|nr:uncharacterized protein W97_08747 [Coniosporium apollinis CBS 100218]EON69487.1 hypothetical protein W97_08747 [Coniosporium apollinis CBS 100218]